MLEVIHNVNKENNANDTSPINMETPSADKTTAHLNRNNTTLTENNDRGSAINVINIPAEKKPCNGAQLENLNINNESPINIEITSAVKTPARMNENNTSSRTSVIPSPKQTPRGYRSNTSKKEKALVPCPFLKRKGHCLKGPRCDFLHKNVLPAACGPKIQQGNHLKPQHHDKSRIPCPFLRKNGFCLKDDRCDFSHHPGSENMPAPISFNHFPFPPNSNYYFPPFVIQCFIPYSRCFSTRTHHILCLSTRIHHRQEPQTHIQTPKPISRTQNPEFKCRGSKTDTCQNYGT